MKASAEAILVTDRSLRMDLGSVAGIFRSADDLWYLHEVQNSHGPYGCVLYRPAQYQVTYQAWLNDSFSHRHTCVRSLQLNLSHDAVTNK